MHLFRTKSHEEKIVEYLVGAGLLSYVPENDAAFYCLAGSCSSVSWPTRPRTRTKPISVAEGKPSDLCDSQKYTSPTSPEIVSQPAEQESILNGDVQNMIFKPIPSLPFPLFQETFRRWKSSMDMQLRFRRLRRLQANIVLQPLDEFPAFLGDFEVHLEDDSHFGFCELLLEFMKVFFAGAEIRLNSSVSTMAWSVTSRVHKTTGEQQVFVDYRFSTAQHILNFSNSTITATTTVRFCLTSFFVLN